MHEIERGGLAEDSSDFVEDVPCVILLYAAFRCIHVKHTLHAFTFTQLNLKIYIHMQN